MRMLKKGLIPSPSRIWYNKWIEKNAKGEVLDVGKSTLWEYGFPTIDTSSKLNPTFIGDICDCVLKDNSYDVVLCNGMYEFVMFPQRMVDECMRILKPKGKVIFGFVGKGYKPYKREWLFYEHGDIKFTGEIKRKDFNNYHFIICSK